MKYENEIKDSTGNSGGLIFFVFCVWSFILLGRPQDYIPALANLRPGLVSTAMILALSLISLHRIQGPPFFQEKQSKYFIALLLVMIIGIPFSLYARLSFHAIFTKYIVVVIYFFFFFKLVNSIGKLKTILLIVCIGGGLYCAVTLSSTRLGLERLSFGTMFDPNDIAYFVLVFLPFNLLFLGRDHGVIVRLTCLASFGAGTLTLLLSGSRGGFLAAAVALFILVARTRAIKATTKMVIVLTALVIASISSFNTERYSTILDLESDYNLNAETGRLALWKIGLRAMLTNPLTGVGVELFPNAVGLDRERRGIASSRWQTAHNSAIQIGAETGLIGLALYLLMSLNVYRILNAIKVKSQQADLIKVAEAGLIGFAGMFTACMFLSQAYSIYWAFYVVFSAVVSQMFLRETVKERQAEYIHT